MLIDIDGPNKGKFRVGHDVFQIPIIKDGLKPSLWYLAENLDSDSEMESVLLVWWSFKPMDNGQ